MKKLNKKGSALLWAVCASMVLTIVVAGILTFGMSYYKRALREATREQAVLYARSAIEYTVNEIVNAANPDFTPTSYSEPVTLTFSFQSGDCTVVISRSSMFQIRLDAAAAAGGTEETLSALIEIDEYDVMTFLGYVNE